MAKYIDEVYVYTDGSCKPNPGTVVYAYLFSNGEQILKGPISESSGEGTNIVAEFKAIEVALENAIAFTRRKVKIHSDCEFVILAINKQRRISDKAKHLRSLLSSVYQKASVYDEVTYTHVSENNKFIKLCHIACDDLFQKMGF